MCSFIQSNIEITTFIDVIVNRFVRPSDLIALSTEDVIKNGQQAATWGPQ